MIFILLVVIRLCPGETEAEVPMLVMQREAERQTRCNHPVSGLMADTSPDTRVEKYVLPWRFPDKAEESRILRSLSSNALSVDFSHQPQFFDDGQFSNHSPEHKWIILQPVYTAAEV